MKKKEKTDNKKSNTRIMITFVVLMVLAFFGGDLVGRLAYRLESTQKLDDIIGYLNDKAAMMFMWALIVLNAIVISIGIFRIRMSKKKISRLDTENEDAYEIYDAVEEKLNLPLLLSSVMVILNLFLFIGMFQTTDLSRMKEPEIAYVFWISFGVFILGSALSFYIQKKLVDLVKQMNPEKRGNVFDIHFRKEWMDSCDEAQQYIAYKAAYNTVNVAQIICEVLLVLMMFAQKVFHTGILPSLVITAIWLTITITYQINGNRLEKGARQSN